MTTTLQKSTDQRIVLQEHEEIQAKLQKQFKC